MSDKKKNWFARHKIVTALLVIVALIWVVGVLGANNSTTTTNSPSSEAPKEEHKASTNLKVGEPVTMGDLTHTLHGVRWEKGDEFMKPEAGTRWIVVDVELKNNGSESQQISTLLMWKLLSSDNRSADVQIGAKTNGTLDGELGASRTLRGEIAFTVPDSGESWELVFEPNILGFGQAIYNISGSDVK